MFRYDAWGVVSANYIYKFFTKDYFGYLFIHGL